MHDDIKPPDQDTILRGTLALAAAGFGALVERFAELAQTHGQTATHQALYDLIDSRVVDFEATVDQLQWILTVAVGREALRRHGGDCDPLPAPGVGQVVAVRMDETAGGHSHGWHLRPGLGYMPADENCATCCQMATNAARLGLTVPAGVVQPTTDTERVTAALDDKAAEAAGEDDR